MADKIFIGRVNVRDTQWGQKIKISLNREDMELTRQHWDMADDRITICIHQSKAGRWYAEIDTWKPSGKRQDAPTPPPVSEPAGNRYDAGDAMPPVGDDEKMPF